MNDPTATSTKYITRAEEDDIRRELRVVQADHKSRAVLLYGPGGIGKTSLVRHMTSPQVTIEGGPRDKTVWLEPIDVDDPERWLLSNLEQQIARQLDPDNRYFAEYRKQLSQLPSSLSADISHETIISYLGRLKEVFARCYEKYVTTEEKTVVIVFDTVETIRGTNLAVTLAQWMKALPTDTLFILSGRPLAGDQEGQRDQLKEELDSRYQGIPVTTIEVGGFARDDARRYIHNSGISGRLVGQEEEALVLLSRGHPLWLAFMIDYLKQEGVPAEATQYPLDYLDQQLSFDRGMTEEGRHLHEAFLRRLVAPYQDTDFWHEAIKRLAVVRQPVARTVWQLLMSDRELPDDVSSMDAAWEKILREPWIRPRANGRYLTLHDAVAEELAQRLFPLHDQDQRWRHGIWQKALDIYSDLAAGAQPRVEDARAALDGELERVDTTRHAEDEPRDDEETRLEAALMSQSLDLDARQRRFDQLRAASLYYMFFADFERGCQQLLEYFGEAEQQHDTFFQDLLVLYLDRFLPGRSSSAAFNDVIRLKLVEFRDWLQKTRPDFYVALGIMVARYLIASSQSEEALKFLATLPEDKANVRQRHDLYLLRGNACLRTSGRVKDAIQHFANAINHAEALGTPDRHKLVAEAYKERGFYYRNTGQWTEADLSYRHAWETIVNALSADSPVSDRKEMASIQTNWAYVKGLDGSYRDGIELAETAITVRHNMKQFADEGLSWSVCGEVFRYARRFEKAWAAYLEAEQLLLEGPTYWDRLGFVYQQQAICLYQAMRDGIIIGENPAAEAEQLIQKALDLCLSRAIRGYPSALNRAGRIISDTDPEAGLKYFEEGISEARRLSDGWFWFANLVEYSELSYRQWRAAEHQPQYRANIEARSAEIEFVAADYSFPDLKGRWSLLQGHLAVHDYQDSGDAGKLDDALTHYEAGFVNIATRHVGSSGVASLRAEFATFGKIFADLPPNVQAAWQAKLRSAWVAAGDVSMLLLARLEELYRPAG
jgi:AAA ATPase domain